MEVLLRLLVLPLVLCWRLTWFTWRLLAAVLVPAGVAMSAWLVRQVDGAPVGRV